MVFASELKIVRALGGRERRRLVRGRPRLGNNLGAVNQLVAVVAKNSELGHGVLEAVHHELLLVDEAFPEACSSRITGKHEVRLQAKLASVVAAAFGEWRRGFSFVIRGSGEPDALK